MEHIPDERVSTTAQNVNKNMDPIGSTIQFRGISALKKAMITNGELPIEYVRDFLNEPIPSSIQNTQQVSQSKDFALQKGGKFAEKIVQKQSYLESNNIFDPSRYFGGLEIEDLDELIPDERLDDMFLEYLSTEMEENEEGCIDNKKAAQKPTISKAFKTPNLEDKTMKENCMNKLNIAKTPQSRTSKSPASFIDIKTKTQKKPELSIVNMFKKNDKPQYSKENINKYIPFVKASTPNILSYKGHNNNSKNQDLLKFADETPQNVSSVKTSQELSVCIRSLLYPENGSKNNLRTASKVSKVANQSRNTGKLLTLNDDVEEKLTHQLMVRENLSPKPKATNPTNIIKSTTPRILNRENRTINQSSVNKSQNLSRSIDKIHTSFSKTHLNIKNFSSFTNNEPSEKCTQPNLNQIGHYKPKSANPSFIEECSESTKTALSPKVTNISKENTNNGDVLEKLGNRKAKEMYVTDISARYRNLAPNNGKHLKFPKSTGLADSSKTNHIGMPERSNSIYKLLRQKLV